MDLENIKELRELKKEKSKLAQKEKDLTEPLLLDLSLIPQIYKWFWDIMDERDCPPPHDSIIQRKKFLFIVISLYYPQFFAGGKMSKGIRNALNDILKYKDASQVSNLYSDVSDFFIFYKTFRNDVSELFDKIVSKLKENGYI